jgi:hypothetical protein
MSRPRRAIECPRDPVALSADEAAAFLRVCPGTFLAAVEKGLMPQPRRLLGRVLWDADELKTAFRQLPTRDLREKEKNEQDSVPSVDWTDAAA